MVVKPTLAMGQEFLSLSLTSSIMRFFGFSKSSPLLLLGFLFILTGFCSDKCLFMVVMITHIYFLNLLIYYYYYFVSVLRVLLYGNGSIFLFSTNKGVFFWGRNPGNRDLFLRE